MLTTIISTVLIVYIISLVLLLILENRDPDKTIAWILLILLLPILGLLVYFYLGQNWKKKKFIQYFRTRELKTFLNKRKALVDDIHPRMESSIKQRLVALAEKGGFGIAQWNNLNIYQNGEKFNALCEALEKAKKFIHIEYYIIRHDDYGKKIRDILIQKAKDGVEVRIMVDFWGSMKFVMCNTLRMRKAGIKAHSFFNPLRLFQHHKINYRNHRKIVVIDGSVGFIGGMNIGEEYITGKKFKAWRDMHLKVEGQIVHQLETIFLYDWYLNRKENIIHEKYFPEMIGYPRKILLQAVSSGPESEQEYTKLAYLAIISNAEKEVFVTTPYLIPDEAITNALRQAALSGVKVHVLVPATPDHFTPFHASRTYFEELLEAGVKIYEYQKGFLHTKAVIADSTVASVGTTNMDIRSFRVNFDVNLIVYDSKAVHDMEIMAKDLIKSSKEIILEEFRKRPLSQKFKQSLCRLLSSLL